MVILYKDPDGKKIFDTTNNGFETTVAVNDLELEKRCTDLEKRLSKYEASECCPSTFVYIYIYNQNTSTSTAITACTRRKYGFHACRKCVG
jgi:hypothetical protein